MKTLESMKQFIRENNFTALVNELVTGADMDVADASGERRSYLCASLD